MIISDILKICNGKLLCGDINQNIDNFTISSKEIKQNCLFFGINTGNKYYMDAIRNGAKAVIIDDKQIINELNETIILVDNTIDAMQKVATILLERKNIPVIAVTGSVGKTSTKDMIYSVLKEKYKVLKTKENYNGQIGVPLTIFELNDEEILIIEMGMDDFGCLRKLTNIVKPDIAVITNIGTAHIGKLGSRENILKAKLEILEGLKENGILILNNDNDLLNSYINDRIRIIKYGINNPSDYCAKNIRYQNNEIIFDVNYINNIVIPNLGNVYIYNSLVATIIGKIFNIDELDIKKGLSEFELSKNRMEIIKINDVTYINDFYNANYDSMKNALEILGTYKQDKIAILGDVFELGNYSKEIHQNIGNEVVKNKINILITIGSDAKYIAHVVKNNSNIEVIQFNNINESVNEIKNIIKKNDVVLFKASHGMNFSLLANQIEKEI